MRFATLFLSSLATFQLGSCFVNLHPTRQTTAFHATSIDASQELKEKFAGLKGLLPENMNVVKCGGYYNMQQLCGNPKEELVKTIIDGIKSADKKVTSDETNDEKIEALATLLYAEGKGFQADLVDGDWAEVLTKQGSKSSSFQKAAEKGEYKGFPINTFDVDSMTFQVGVNVLKKGRVYSRVKYSPSTDAYSKTEDGKIVLRRIGCDIEKATFKWWKLPTLNLFFLKRKGGFLEFLYMDDDIRITRGNRGGLFVHFRPEFVEALLA